MLKNRFSLIVAVFFVLIVSLAISSSSSNAQKSVTPSINPVTGAKEPSDYYQRHPEHSAPAVAAVDMSDYFFRHPELRRGLPTFVHTILPDSLIDECFDVSVSELAACREASQSAGE